MKVLWIVLLVGFAALNVYAFAVGEWVDFLGYLNNLGPWGLLATADLLIALIIAMAYMWRDAQSKGINPLPYVVLTLATGSLGLLIYLVRFWDIERPAKSS